MSVDEFALQQDRLKLILQINNAIASVLDLRELFLTISRCLHPIFQHDGGGIRIYSAEKHEIRAFAMDLPEGVEFDPEGSVLPMEGSPAGVAFLSRHTVIVSEPDRTKYFSTLSQKLFV